jgi:hypothetical protein
MADWYGSARTNYFRVKDREGFEIWAAASSLKTIERDGRFGIFSEDCFGGWPSSVPSADDPENYRDFDVVQELARHVEPGEIVVCMEVGAEKLRYVTGAAVAFRVVKDEIERISISVEDIYDLARQRWGCEPTLAAY